MSATKASMSAHDVSTFDELLDRLCAADEDPAPSFSPSWPHGPLLGAPMTWDWLWAHPGAADFVSATKALGLDVHRQGMYFYVRLPTDRLLQTCGS